jgi:hypothetical protein
LDAATKEGISREKVSPYEMSYLGTALSIGESPLPLGVAVKVSNQPATKAAARPDGIGRSSLNLPRIFYRESVDKKEKTHG